jgi:hypothetical protein
MTRVLACLALLTSPAYAGTHHEFHSKSRSTWGEPSAITCEIVRTYVSEMGLARARAMAVAYGMTTEQEQRAMRCLARRG